MVPEKVSKLELGWVTRLGGGGATERRYRDFLVDGVALSKVIKSDHVSPFGWGSVEEQFAAVDRLLRRATADLPDGRVSLYVCPECGDLGCGAVSLMIEGAAGGVVWRDFALQNNYDDAIHRDGYEDVGPFFFEGWAYHQVLEQLRRDVRGDGV